MRKELRPRSFRRISYTLTTKDIVFPGNPPVEITQMLSMEQADLCNAWTLTLFNHNGTHLDFPNHYQRLGRKVTDYLVDELVFSHPYLLNLPRQADEAIKAADLKDLPSSAREADLLFLRTGFGACRGDQSYVFGPYLTEEAAQFLRAAFPHLRCLGLDCLSATNPKFMTVGEAAHRILLSDEPDSKPVLILEDLDLTDRDLIGEFRRVFVVPLFVEGVDGGPCTVFGETNT